MAKPLVTTDSTFKIIPDRTVKASFAEPDSDQEIFSSSANVFHTLMISPPLPIYKQDPPVHEFNTDGFVTYRQFSYSGLWILMPRLRKFSNI